MNGTMYDEILLRQAMIRKGLNYERLGKRAGVDPKTAKSVILTGSGHPDSIFAIAKTLGFDVKPDDFSAIMKKNGNGRKKRDLVHKK